MNSAAELRVGEDGRYLLRRVITATEVGCLWEAEDTRDGSAVSVELLPRTPPTDEAKRRALGYAMLACRQGSEHGSLLSVRDTWTPVPDVETAMTRWKSRLVGRVPRFDDPTWFFVLDPFPGARPLAHPAVSGDLSVDHALELGARVASAVARLHAAGVTHGSIDETNVLIDGAGNVKFVDALIGAAMRSVTRPSRRDDLASLRRVLGDLLPADLMTYEVATTLQGALNAATAADIAEILGGGDDPIVANEAAERVPVAAEPPLASSPAPTVKPGRLRRWFPRWRAPAVAIPAGIALALALWVALAAGETKLPPATAESRNRSMSTVEITVPDVSGLHSGEAREMLGEVGLEGSRAKPVLGKPGLVVATRPPAGASVPRATKVLLLVGAEASRLG